jgi:SpoU rRNA methylase family enzyme
LGQDEFEVGAEILVFEDLASVLEVAPTVLLTDASLRGKSMLIVHSLRHALHVIHTSCIGPTLRTL